MIDSHCHLDHEPLYSDLKNVLKRSKDIGIKKLLTISTSIESFSRVKDIVNKDDIIFGTIGIHPHEADKNVIDSEFFIKNLNENKKIIGIGETGLDFYYDNSDRDKQIESFKIHIEAALKANIPLIIHSRNAEEKTFDILNEYKKEKLKILMHCFTGSQKFAEQLLKFNSYFSASGIITFKNSTELQKTFKFLPLDKILIETDSPFLAPVPNRGKKNEPSFIDFTATKLAEIKDIKKSNLRNIMGIVNQDSILFNDTIYNNIKLSNQSAKKEDVINAAKVANAHDFILKTESGYDTIIGDQGNKLSGGQKQRLSIARAVLKNPDILILDEATSSLDTKSEKLVQESLENLMKSRTSLIIAHRLSTIKNADKIIVLDKGKVVEEGTHDHLIKKKGHYKKLYDLQSFN